MPAHPDPAAALAIEFNRAIMRHFGENGLTVSGCHDIFIAAGTIVEGYMSAIEPAEQRAAALERFVSRLRAKVLGGGSA
jgi:hypothetical protein